MTHSPSPSLGWAEGQGVPDLMALEFTPFRDDDALLNMLGTLTMARFDLGVVLRLVTNASTANAAGFVHGGALSAVTDVAMFEVAKAHFGTCVTISQDMQFLRATKPGSVLQAVARAKRLGRRMAFCTADVFEGPACLAAANAVFAKVGS
ncbi:PaaI family thioesterase [Limibacillus sp. MBR-115]|uniref:PaaI family thioesterase n=1 Tax=Limibacillus sp. MBR-115 TaxID=3156465 RepID=UPI0033912E83